MEVLLDPNIAYLVLVAATFFILIALAVPGTGLPEVLAMFSMFMAGYAVYQLSFNWWALVLLLVSLVPFFFAVRGPRRELWLALSILGLIAGSLFFFPADKRLIAVSPALAAGTSAIYGIVLWVLARKVVQSAQTRPAQDLSALMGQFGEAKTAIRQDGSAQVAGELWSARSQELIPVGSPIKVVGREGFILVVEKGRSPES
jgi:membrane-bound serine protease (ClpP class)